ncbi:glycosyltransferase family 2 protein [Rubellimicrobium rubrum]|nr:glycosyltransferase family 2 protein [Rubellimicrobium rubrum]
MSDTMQTFRNPSDRPRVSVIMANWQGERFISDAIASVLAQSMGDLEVLVADDASTDRSTALVQEMADRDSRVHLLATEVNGGPSAARNRALAAARGEWIAVMDSDDVLHPRRLELLLEAATRHEADLVADDMAAFGDGPGLGGWTLLGVLGLRDVLTVSPAYFVDCNGTDRTLPQLGYLKPLIRRSALGGIRYDPRIRVGEDYDLYLRLLLQGARFCILPLPLYLYRRHATSLSHRLSVKVLEPLLDAHNELVRSQPTDSELGRALAQRSRMLERSLRYERLVAAIKARAVGPSAGLVLRDPFLLRLLARSLTERWTRPTNPGERSASASLRVALVPEGRDVGTEGTYDEVLTVWPLGPDRLDDAPRIQALVCRLTELASNSPIDVTAVGLAGLDCVGLVPNPDLSQVILTEAEAERLPTLLPARTRLTVVRS